MPLIFHRFLALLALFACVALTACGSWDYKPAAAEPTALIGGDYLVAANDVLTVTVFGENDLSGDYTVAGNGQIDLKLAGPVVVAGQSVTALPALLAGAYKGGYLADPKISVALKSARPFFVLGEVNAPGSFPWQPDTTIARAAALAGGFTARGNQNAFDIIRNDVPVNGGVLATPVMPGDVVRVKERVF